MVFYVMKTEGRMAARSYTIEYLENFCWATPWGRPHRSISHQRLRYCEQF